MVLVVFGCPIVILEDVFFLMLEIVVLDVNELVLSFDYIGFRGELLP